MIFSLVSSVLMLSRPKTVYALGSLCYNPNNGGIQETATSGGEDACRNIGATVIKAGDALPVKVCLVGNNVQGISATGSEDACTNVGGQVLQQGEPLPSFATDEDVENSKNRANNNQDPGGITSEERKNLAECSATDREGNVIAGDAQECLEENPIITTFLRVINFLSAGVGVVVTIVLIVAGIQYSSAGGDPSKVKAAKTRITNAVIALIAYFFLFAFLQWIIPGGFF